MDEDRRIRFLVAPLLLLASLGWGVWLDPVWKPTLQGLLNQPGNENGFARAVAIVAGGGIVVFTLGVVIGTLTYTLLRGGWWLIRRWSDHGVKTHEVSITDETLRRVWNRLHAPNPHDRRQDFFAATSFDYGILSKENPEVHRWMIRRWSAFSIDVTSVSALVLSLIIGCLAQIRFSPQWYIPAVVAIGVFSFAARWAWRDTMQMLAFQATLPVRAAAEHRHSNQKNRSNQLDGSERTETKMIEIFRIPLTKAQLRGIPADERNLLLLSSHAVNQIATIRKLVIFSTNYRSDVAIENLLSAAQSQTILRLLFGALAETWEMVKRPVNQKIIGIQYIDGIAQEGRNSYEALKNHFGRSNLLHTLRNSFSFHHPSNRDLEAAFENVPEDEDLAWYPSRTVNNSFYLASDVVITAGVIRASGEADAASAFGKVMDEVILVSNELTDFLLFLMRAIIARYFGPEFLDLRNAIIIADAPNLYEFAIPFFTVRGDE